MKKQKNATRVIAIVLVLLMALALIPIAASAESCTISFDVNGGSVAEGHFSPHEEVTAADGKIQMPSAAGVYFSKDSFELLGWDEAPNGAPPAYKVAQDYTFSANTTLYAIWGARITLMKNDGTSTSTEVDTDASGSVTLPNDTGAGFTRAGYTFQGWGDSATATTATYAAGAATITSSTTLYALWTMNDPVRISFDANGKTASNMPEAFDVPSGVDSPLPNNEPAATGFTFAGWGISAAQDPASPSYAKGGTINVTEATTLYALWRADYQLILDGGNGGKTSGGQTTTTTPYANTGTPPTVTLDSNGAPFTNTGYTFKEWTSDSAGATAITSVTFTDTDEGRVQTAYAQWNPDPVTIVFDPGDTACVTVTGETATGSSLRGKDYMLPDIPSNWTPKTGYAFAGWKVGEGAVQKAGQKMTWPTGFSGSTLTLTAQWVEEYDVIFYKNDGTTAKVSTAKVKKGEKIGTLPSSPTQTDKLFRGWYDTMDATGGNEITADTVVNGPMSVYARWATKYLTVNFDENGGSGTQTAGIQAERGKSYTLPACTLKAPAGKMFDKWEINGTTYDPGDPYDGVKDFADDVTEFTVKALWTDDHIKGTVTVSGTPEVGKKLTASPTIEYPNPPGVIQYQWERSDSDAEDATWTKITSATAKDYTVQAGDNGMYLRCTVSCSNKPGSSLVSNVVGSVIAPTVQMSINQSGGVGTVKLSYSDGTVIAEVTTETASGPVMKNTPVTMTVTPPDGKVVDKVDGKNPSTSYSYTLTADKTVTITYKDAGSHDAKNITIYPGTTLKTESTDSISQTAKAEAITAISSGDESRTKAAVYDVTACYNNNPSDPVLDQPTEVEKKSFTIYFPTDVKKGSYGSGTFDAAWTYSVYHYDPEEGTLEEVSNVTYNKSGSRLTATITGMSRFSPFVAAAVPMDLTGTVVLTADGSEIGSTAEVYPGQTLAFKEVRNTNAVDKSFHYTWQYSTGAAIPGAVADKPYTVTDADKGSSIICVVTHETQTGEIESGAHKVNSSKPNPTVLKHVVNPNGSVQLGEVGGVTTGMQYICSSSKPTSSDIWNDIKSVPLKLDTAGRYYFRYKNEENDSYWVYRDVYQYYTVQASADSVSVNRLGFSASSSSYIINKGTNYWWVREGYPITVTATSSNTTYYKITAIWSVPNAYANKSNQKVNSLSLKIDGSYMYQPYVVYASAGVYGSKTGDNSHLGLWMELACISLMGLCAAAVFGRKKLKKQ